MSYSRQQSVFLTSFFYFCIALFKPTFLLTLPLRKLVLGLSLLFGLLASIGTAQAATNFQVDSYTIYTDGTNLYLKAEERFVPIGTDIVVPVFITDGPHLKLTPIGDANAGYTITDIDPFPSGLTRVYDLDILVGDFDGEGTQDLLLVPNSSGSDSSRGAVIVVFGTYDAVSVYAESYTHLQGVEVVDAIITVRDVNDDGQDEIVLQDESGLTHVADYNAGAFLRDRFPQRATVVGNTPTDFEVTYGGAASYKVPLNVPTGAAGLRPNISLNYNSQYGNGVMGLGWQLSTGMAQITECYKRNTNTKIRCLNGEELNNVGGDYYRTKIDSGILIHKVSDSQYTLHYENGTTKTLNRRLTSPSVYLEETHKQRGGASYTVTWDVNTTNREPLVESIAYQGNSIEFIYEDRSDSRKAYYMGAVRNRTQRLVGVTTKADGKVARQYEVFYEYDSVSGLSKVTNIQECAGNGECLKPLYFYWSDSGSKGVGTDINSPGQTHWVVNYDNDGLTDGTDRSSSGKSIHISTGNSNGVASRRSSWSNDIGSSGKRQIMFGDITGDGRDDLVYVETDGDIYYKWNRGNGFGDSNGHHNGRPTRNEPEGRNALIDIDGDGDQDFLNLPFSGSMTYRLSSGGHISSSASSLNIADTSPLTRLSVADVNGDGLSDIVLIKSDNINAYINKGDRTFSAVTTSLPASSRVDIVDMNGDGLPDLFVRVKDKLYIYSNDGTGKFLSTNVVSKQDRYIESTKDVFKFIDLNSDGLLDLWVYPKPQDNWHRYQIAYNLGDGKYSGWQVNTNFHGDKTGNSKSHVADINGDGTADILHSDKDADYNRETEVLLGQAKRPYITTFSDSYGNQHKADYLKLTDDEVYTRDRYDEGIDFGDTKPYQQALTVVKSITTPDDTVYYKYAGARMHNGEHGYLGFSSITSSLAKKDANDEGVALVTTSYLHQDYPLVGKLKRVNKKVYKGIGAKTAIENIQYDYNAEVEPGVLIAKMNDTIEGWVRAKHRVEVASADFDLQFYGNFGGTFSDGATGTSFTGQMNSFFEWQNINLSGGVKKAVLVEKTVDHIELISGQLSKREAITANWSTVGSQYVRLDNRSVTTQDKNKVALSTVSTTYTYENTDTYGLPEAFLVNTATRTTQTYAGNGLKSDTHTLVTEYDYYTGGTQKDLIKDQWLNKNDTTYTDPGKGNKTSYTYDSYGNITSTTVLANSPDDNRSESARNTARTYSSNGKYLATETNAIGHTTTYSQYTPNGLPGRVQSPNGLVALHYYDGFGRHERTYDHLGNNSYTRRGFCADTDCYSWEQTEPAGGAQSIRYWDKQGRLVKAATQTLSSQWQVQAWQYDDFGRVDKESTPRLQSLGASVSFDTGDFTEFTYDELSRVVVKNLPGDDRTVETSYAREHAVKVTDPEGRIWQTETNALGQTIAKGRTEGYEAYDGITSDTRVSFLYDAQGNVLEQSYPKVMDYNVSTGISTISGTHKIINTYDRYGNQTSLDDPNAGYWEYDHNAYGELITQTDANGNKTHFSYDELGRMVTQRDNETFTVWEYDQNGFSGLLYRVRQYDITGLDDAVKAGLTASSPGGELSYEQIINYDSRTHQLQTVTTRQRDYEGTLMPASTRATEYDTYGRVLYVTLPALYKNQGSLSAPRLEYEYSGAGYLTKVKDRDSSRIYQHIKDVDNWGNISEQSLGNGALNIFRQYQSHTGWADGVQVEYSDSTLMLDQSYSQYDKLGLMGQRDDTVYYNNGNSQSWVDRFYYQDSLEQQLTKVAVSYEQDLSGAISQQNWEHNYRYDALGNMRQQTLSASGQLGAAYTLDYQYSNSAKPHQLTDVSGGLIRHYGYDTNGNTQSDGEKTFSYFSWNKVNQITKGDTYTRFEYGPDRMRTLRVDNKKNVVLLASMEPNVPILADDMTETIYVGNYERVSKGGKVEHKYYVGGIAIITQEEGENAENTSYLITDYQNSLIATTDANGQLQQRFRYTPYGEQVDVSRGMIGAFESVTTRGYTAHEHIEGTDIIHMNGRIYDSAISRFLQADPVVQSPTFVLSYNRYAYVWNNPITNTDPSGYFTVESSAGSYAGAYNGSQSAWQSGNSGCSACGGGSPTPTDDNLHGEPEGLGDNDPITPQPTPDDDIDIGEVGPDVPDPEANGMIKEQLEIKEMAAVGPLARVIAVAIVRYVIKRAREIYNKLKAKREDTTAGQPKTIEDLKNESTPGRQTKGRTDQYDKPGGVDEANNDFDALQPEDVKDIPGGRTGTIDKTKKVNVRESSTDGRPTLEVQDGKNKTKFRYDD